MDHIPTCIQHLYQSLPKQSQSKQNASEHQEQRVVVDLAHPADLKQMEEQMAELVVRMAGLQLELQLAQTNREPLVEPEEDAVTGTAHSLLRSFIPVASSFIALIRSFCSNGRGGSSTCRGGVKATACS